MVPKKVKNLQCSLCMHAGEVPPPPPPPPPPPYHARVLLLARYFSKIHALTHLHASCLCRPHCLDHCLHQVLGIFHKHHVSLEWKTMHVNASSGRQHYHNYGGRVCCTFSLIFCRVASYPGAGESNSGDGESYPGAPPPSPSSMCLVPPLVMNLRH